MNQMGFVLIAAVATLGLGAGQVHAQAKPVEKITIQFHTVDDDKDYNTKVWTYLKAGDTILAEKEKYADSTRFADPGDSEEFTLNIPKKEGLTTADLAKFKVVVQSQAQGGAGNDNWEFMYTITIYLKDGTKIQKKEEHKQKLNSRGGSKVEVSSDFEVK
jgi:hypothetical protein